jgi:hypothetical protein
VTAQIPASPCRRNDQHDAHEFEVYGRTFRCPGVTFEPAEGPKATSRFLPTVVSILKAEEDHDRMDCCDDDPRKVWVVVGAWSFRRAVLTHAAPFLAAAGTDDLPSVEGRDFLCRLDLNDPPPFEHEGGERLEWPDLRPAPPMSEVYARLGITPPEEGQS